MSENYTVWEADVTEDEGETYDVSEAAGHDAGDAARMARRYAAELHAADPCRHWPKDFLVRHSVTKVVRKFTVELEAVPEFWCGVGEEVKPGPHDRDDCPCGHPFGELGPCAGCNCADGAP